MTRLGVQLHTLRTLDEPLPDTLARVADTAFEGVEFAALDETPPEELRETLVELDLANVGGHVGYDRFADEYDEIVETYGALGCERLLIPTFDGSKFETADGAREAAGQLSSLADRLADDGFDLCYHNHSFEFTDLGEEMAFDVFVDALDGVDLEIDIGLATHAGADPLDLLERYGDQAPLVHVTDSVPGSRETLHVDLGEGVVDIDACVEQAIENGAEWLVFEQGLTDDPMRSVEHAADRLADLLASN